MKKQIFIILIMLLFYSNMLFSEQEKIYKNIKQTINVSDIRKQKIQTNLYTSETQAKNYINFLIDNKLLEIDNNSYYSISLIDEKTKWHILLYLSEKTEAGYIIDTFDYPLKYSFLLNKRNGQITEFYSILQQ